MESFITRICKCLFTLLGFSAVGCSSITREEYGTPYADFEVKGKVVDAGLSQPVQGLKVSAMEQGKCGSCRWFLYCEGNGMHLRNDAGELMLCHMDRII